MGGNWRETADMGDRVSAVADGDSARESYLGVAVVRYLTPVASLDWLLVLGLIGDVDLRLLGCGAARIICANGRGWRMRI